MNTSTTGSRIHRGLIVACLCVILTSFSSPTHAEGTGEGDPVDQKSQQPPPPELSAPDPEKPILEPDGPAAITTAGTAAPVPDAQRDSPGEPPAPDPADKTSKGLLTNTADASKGFFTGAATRVGEGLNWVKENPGKVATGVVVTAGVLTAPLWAPPAAAAALGYVVVGTAATSIVATGYNLYNEVGSASNAGEVSRALGYRAPDLLVSGTALATPLKALMAPGKVGASVQWAKPSPYDAPRLGSVKPYDSLPYGTRPQGP